MKKPLVEFTDFLKLDARAGEIKTAIKVENSNKLLELTLDLGEEYGIVTILSGIAKYFTPESLIGKKVPVMANIAPKQMAGKTSNGFILMVDLVGHIPVLIELPPTTPNGSTLC
jgi:methionyl-tRNA synthetase